MPASPQDRRPPAKKVTASSKKRQEKADDEALDRGFAISDGDQRLSIRLRDIRGDQEAALVKETGYDFLSLLEAFDRRQGTDLLAALIWFARHVHGVENKSYDDTLKETGYADYLDRDVDEPEPREAPKA